MKKANLTRVKRGSAELIKWKNLFFIFAMCLVSSGMLARSPMATKQQTGMFKNSKTCIVLENGSLAYNVYIREAVQKHWNITEFEFIDKTAFEERRFDTKYSFLILVKGTYKNDPGGVSYSFLSLLLGGATNNITNMPEICAIPIAYADDNSMDYGYGIPAMVKFIQKHAKTLEKKRFCLKLTGMKYYNNGGNFKNKALLLNKKTLSPDADSPGKIKSLYPYYIKLLSTAEIEAELAENPVNTLFNYHVGPAQSSGVGKCFEMIFDTDGNLWYYNYRDITNDKKDGFNLRDFYRIR
jgi:hypothetical protein